MANEIERAEAALVAAIRVHEVKLTNLREALVRVQSGSPNHSRAAPLTSEFADSGIIAGATRLLEQQGEMTTRQIADRLLSGGIKTRAKNYVATVHATLRNSPKRFQFRHLNKRELGWSLKPQEHQ